SDELATWSLSTLDRWHSIVCARVVFVSYSDIKAEFDAAASRPETVNSSFLLEFRRLHPEYKSLSDAQLADTVHKQFYSDMPREQFDKKLPTKSRPQRRRRSSFRANCTSIRGTPRTRRSQTC